MKLKFTDNDKNKITLLQSKLFDDHITYKEYLETSLNLIHEVLLKTYTEEKYVFGKVYFLGALKEFDFQSVGFYNDKNSYENQIFHNGIKKAEELVIQKKATSLSVVLIRKKLRGIVLIKGKAEDELIPGFNYYNYSDPEESFIDSLPEDKGLKTEELAPIIKIHESMAAKCKSNTYSYLIRTRNFDDDFNGSLYLVLKEALSVDDYAKIVDFFTFIMQAKIKYAYKKEILNRTVIDELSHSWKHTFGSLHNHLREIYDSEEIKTNEILNKHCLSAFKQVKNLTE